MQSFSLNIIILWKLFQGTLANSYFSNFKKQLFFLFQDCEFLRNNLEKFKNLKTDKIKKLTKKELLYIEMLNRKENYDEKKMKKNIKECELLILEIIKEINFDETENQIKFCLCIPMNMTLLKSVGISFMTTIIMTIKIFIK